MRTRQPASPARFSITSAVLVSVLLLTSACASRRTQLERVAKDWCETIRASQVIPVYPPTADLLPGDMFLVDRPVRDQHTEWEARGFLALPFELPRMSRDELPALNERYDASRWTPLRRDGAPGDSPRPAPGAAFPSYSFAVSNGGSFDLALPVQGVPVGLSALAGSASSGTISMKGVTTFAYDNVELTRAVRGYWADSDRRQFLRNMRHASSGGEVYVRVVSRVYAVKTFSVVLSASAQRGAAANAGAGGAGGEAASVPGDAETPESLNSALDRIDDARASGLPGVSTRFLGVSSRVVTLEDHFDEPLVVGYLALDLPVNARGELGWPVATFDVLSGDATPNIAWAGAVTRQQRSFRDARATIESMRASEGDEDRLYRDAAARLSSAAVLAYDAARGARPPDAPAEAFNEAVLAMLEGVDAQGELADAIWGQAHRALHAAIESFTPTPDATGAGGGGD